MVTKTKKTMIFLLGSPRSGTSWLAKIFDSHPDVLYHHEPDSIMVSQDIPFHPEYKEIEGLIPKTRDYFTSLIKVRHLKSTGSLPFFHKNYYNSFINNILPYILFLLKSISSICNKLKLPINIQGPAFIQKRATQDKAISVIKSVNSPGRAALITHAFPKSYIIYILRHPCGYVSSQIRGRKSKYLENTFYYKALASMDLAKERGWTEDRIKAMSFEEQLACSWVCINEKVMNEIKSEKNIMILLYEDLCDNPLDISRKLFQFCNLAYDDQTDEFLKKNLNYSGNNEKYYQTVRDPKKAATKWKKELSTEQIEEIRNIVSGTKSGDKFSSLYD